MNESDVAARALERRRIDRLGDVDVVDEPATASALVGRLEDEEVGVVDAIRRPGGTERPREVDDTNRRSVEREFARVPRIGRPLEDVVLVDADGRHDALDLDAVSRFLERERQNHRRSVWPVGVRTWSRRHLA